MSHDLPANVATAPIIPGVSPEVRQPTRVSYPEDTPEEIGLPCVEPARTFNTSFPAHRVTRNHAFLALALTAHAPASSQRHSPEPSYSRYASQPEGHGAALNLAAQGRRDVQAFKGALRTHPCSRAWGSRLSVIEELWGFKGPCLRARQRSSETAVPPPRCQLSELQQQGWRQFSVHTCVHALCPRWPQITGAPHSHRAL